MRKKAILEDGQRASDPGEAAFTRGALIAGDY